jgi:predicted MFS family arabinose efflux permease
VVLAGCFLLSVGFNGFIISPSSIAPLLAERFAVPQAATGDVVSAVFVGTILTQVPGGYLLDRYDNRRLVAAATAGFVAVVLATQPVESFTAFLVLRALGGVTAGFLFTAGATVVGQVFDADRTGFATGVYLASPSVAFVVAHATSPLVGTAVGPLRVFLLHALSTLLGTALVWAGAGGPIRGDSAPAPGEFARALGNRSVILVALSAGTVFAMYVFLNTWVPTYGREVLELPLWAAGVVAALVPLVGVAARPGGGWLSSRLGDRRRPVLGGGLLAGLALTVAIPFVGGLAPFLLLLSAGAFSLQLGFGVYYVLAGELAAPGTEGTSLTLMTSIAFTGSLAAPVAGGWLIGGIGWTGAFLAFAGAGVLGALALLPVSEPRNGRAVSAGADGADG